MTTLPAYRIDPIAITAPTLAAGAARREQLPGVALQPGGDGSSLAAQIATPAGLLALSLAS